MRVQGDVERDLGISVTQMGWIFSVFWLAYALFEIPGGWMGDRFGARKTLTRIVLAWSVFTALTGAAVGFLSLFTWRFLFGVGEAGAYPNIARVQSRWLPRNSQGMASGMLWLVARWGGALAPLLFGMLLRWVDSRRFRGFLEVLPVMHGAAHLAAWRLAFWVAGIAGIVWVVLFYPWFRDDPAQMPKVNAAELDLIRADGLGESKRHSADDRIWRDLFTSRNLWALALVYVFGSFGWSFFASWMPLFLKERHGLNFDRSEWLSALPMLCGGATCLLGGWMSDALIRKTNNQWLGRALLPIVGRLISAGAMLAVVLAHTPQQAVMLMCVTLAFYDLGQGANWAAIIDIGGKYAGTAAGFINMIGNLGGNVLQPIIAPHIFRNFGWERMFAVYAGTYVMSAVMWMWIDPARKFYEEKTENRRQ
jgi:MFS family permease